MRDNKRNLDAVQLDAETTGYAIVYNRAALQIKTEELAGRLGLKNVEDLLKEQKLHIVYFQSEAVLPAALTRASEAKEEAREAKEKADKLEKRFEGIRRVYLRTTYALLWFLL